MDESDTDRQSAGRELRAGGLVIEPSRRIRSDDFEWDHEIRIAVPDSYADSDQSYPVLWATDGSFLFDLAVQVYGVVRRHVPEMIIVGVGAPPEAAAEVHRRRLYEFTCREMHTFTGFGGDLFTREFAATEEAGVASGMRPSDATGGAEAFLRLLVDTIRPELAADYRMTDDHTLAGDSAGGLFCAYAFLTRPSAFARYLCGSPALNCGDSEIFRLEEAYSRSHDDLPAKIFFGAGEGEILEGGAISAVGIVSSMARLAELLRMRNYPSLDLQLRILPGEDHGSVIPVNLTHGLRALWQGDFAE